MVQVVPALWRVHWLQVVGLFGVSGPAKRLALVLWSCVPSFCPLSRFVFGVLSLNMVLFRVFRGFLARFRGFVWVCVILVRCVACVALYACGVRRIKGLLRVCLPFILLPFSFCLSFHLFTCFLSFALSALFWLSFACPLVLSCLFLWSLLLFPFPFRTMRKKKGRAVLVRPLFVCRERSNSCNVIEELRCCCFGSF